MKNYLPKILLTGANGQVGMSIRHHAEVTEFQLLPCSQVELDITHLPSILSAMTTFTPDVVINAAAYTAVDKAEQEVAAAMQVNHLGAKNLAIACQHHHVPLIHLSTDYVFDGTHTSPYQENEKANPISVYGKSKWRGEEAVREHCEQSIILRISGVFSAYGNNFVKTMLRLAQEKKELRIVSDQITCPTYAGDIASVLFSIVKQSPVFGTYHYCNAEAVSWHQFATSIIEIARESQPLSVEKVTAIRTADYPTLAKRPTYSVLDCSKIEKNLGLKQSSWRQALSVLIPQWKKE